MTYHDIYITKIEKIQKEKKTKFKWIETLNFPFYLGGPIGEYFGKPILEFIWKQNLNNLKEIFEK